jgi:hypothetical protein
LTELFSSLLSFVLRLAARIMETVVDVRMLIAGSTQTLVNFMVYKYILSQLDKDTVFFSLRVVILARIIRFVAHSYCADLRIRTSLYQPQCV